MPTYTGIPQPQIVIPRSLLEIKTPQLIGIICGLIVFLVTVASVLYLFYLSGSYDRLKKELTGEANSETSKSASIPSGYLIEN